ncbi:AraC family transcriptional regulator [soil metagenome]
MDAKDGHVRFPVPATTLLALFEGLEASGIDTNRLCGALALNRRRLEERGAVVDGEVLHEVWRFATESDPSPDMPVRAGIATPISSLGLLDHLLNRAESVGKGLKEADRYFRLVTTEIELDVKRRRTGIWMRVAGTDQDDQATIAAESWTLALFASRFRSAKRSVLMEVHMRLPRWTDDQTLAELFEAPVRLGRTVGALRLSRHAWDRPMPPFSNATPISGMLSSEVEDYLAAPVSYALRLRLPGLLRNGESSVDGAAGMLGLATRTLQRRLIDEGTSYRAELAHVRRSCAERRLMQNGQSVAEISRDLGYGETSAFTHAFRSWTGHSPSSWQALNGAAQRSDENGRNAVVALTGADAGD